MINKGDILILRDDEYRDARGTIMVEITAIGCLRQRHDGYWLPVKCIQHTGWGPVVRFIEIRTVSAPAAKSRAI